MTKHTPGLQRFITAYLECALWSSTAYGSPDEFDDDGNRIGTFDSSFQDCNYGADDLAPELLSHVQQECQEFYENYRPLWAPVDWYTDEQAGHDFWLTRNRHGAGFWDRGLPGTTGRALTDAAKGYGSEDWYLDQTDPDAHVIREG